MEPPGIKKYSNENIFLNSLNDLTRSAYSNNTKANSLDNKPVNRFDTDILLNSKESFESNNSRLNSLQEEILSLKRKLNVIPEKDEKIQEQKCEIEKLNDQITLNSSIQSELQKLKSENKTLRDNYDRLQLENMNNNKLKQENDMLKKKIIELNSQLKKKEIEDEFSESDIQDIMTEDYEDNLDNSPNKEKIEINIVQLKNVLSNRLKSYHDKHIENLIDTYNLRGKTQIDKEIMEKLLLEAIHI
jgi:septal ring factor EnvC (AmiA/AmiB activator)